MISRTLPFQHGAITQTRMVLPESWAPYLINADKSGFDRFSPEDQAAIQATRKFGHCVDCSDDAAFVWHHDACADGVLPGMCLTYTFVESAH